MSITAPAVTPAPQQVARAAAVPPNDLQRSLSTAAMHLPTAGANFGAHLQRLQSVPDVQALHATVGDAASDIQAHMHAFLGR